MVREINLRYTLLETGEPRLFFHSLIMLSPFQGMSMPIAHVEESWQMAEFYNNKVLFISMRIS